MALSLKIPPHLKYLVKCQKVMVSVGVSRMGKTGIVFVEPGAKGNNEYYCQIVIGGGLLPDIRARCQRYSWTLQQDSTPSRSSSLTCGPQTART